MEQTYNRKCKQQNGACTKSNVRNGKGIKHNNSYSAFIYFELGVKQGDPSSPMIFMMFINDLNENINNNLNSIFTVNDMEIFLLLYADDQVIF